MSTPLPLTVRAALVRLRVIAKPNDLDIYSALIARELELAGAEPSDEAILAEMSKLASRFPKMFAPSEWANVVTVPPPADEIEKPKRRPKAPKILPPSVPRGPGQLSPAEKTQITWRARRTQKARKAAKAQHESDCMCFLCRR